MSDPSSPAPSRRAARRSTTCTASWAAAWSTSPAGRCRCTTRPGSSPSTGTAASAAALFDVSHMGQVLVRGAGAAEAFERLVPGDITGLAEGPPALHPVHRRAGRRARRPDRRPGRGRPVRRGQCRLPRSRPRPHAGRARARRTGRGADRARAARAAGAGGGRGDGAPRPARVRARLHAGGRDDGRRRCPAASRAPATPARTASRSRLRPSRPTDSRAPPARPSARSRRRASARAIRCASRPGCASTATS